jgi:hypothetical protein
VCFAFTSVLGKVFYVIISDVYEYSYCGFESVSNIICDILRLINQLIQFVLDPDELEFQVDLFFYEYYRYS